MSKVTITQKKRRNKIIQILIWFRFDQDTTCFWIPHYAISWIPIEPEVRLQFHTRLTMWRHISFLCKHRSFLNGFKMCIYIWRRILWRDCLERFFTGSNIIVYIVSTSWNMNRTFLFTFWWWFFITVWTAFHFNDRMLLKKMLIYI